MAVPGHLAGAVTALAAIFIVRYVIKATSKPRPPKRISPTEERVLIIGASSGLGRTLARQYGARGARVCVVARRSAPLFELAGECGDKCLPVLADFTDAAAIGRVRDEISREWGGLDTMHVCAGVSAVQPVMALTGIGSSEEDAPVAGIRRAADVAATATEGNFFGPLMAALTFIPMLKRTSEFPAILLVSSVAAVIPAPTRALYAATKAASLLLFQSLAIEHPEIAFTFVLPATIEGNFRSSAVDADPDQPMDETNKKGLSQHYVAGRCTDAVDRGLRGNVVIPWVPYGIARHLYNLWPSFIEKQARKKYDFTA
ncbi:short-chain dehydrogenase [Xylariaceae sp. FL0594]|nr:short-chain dehydrogenase [Xylariaceae sp. FL0594]